MSAKEREELELAIRTSLEAGDLDRATTMALRGYGPEVYRFLVAFNHDEAAAADVFSTFAEGLWQTLRTFDWAYSVRSLAFGIARRASLRYRRDRGRRAAKELPLETSAMLSRLEEQIRTGTLPYLRTEVQHRFAELREELSSDDRALLILRLDQGLSWNDCARAIHQGDEPLRAEELKRESARLRKRFQSLRERLLAIGRSEGLLGKPDGTG